MKIDTDPKKIEDFLTRGVENIYPNKEFVKNLLLSGKKITMYLGMDPTAPTLHIGNFVPVMKLKEFQDLGHQVILLIGDFTATIGDPDKLSVRKPLTRRQVLNNCKLYKKQLSTLIKFGFSGAKLVYNSKWLGKMNFEDVLNLASKMTVDQMLKRDMFQERIKQGRPVYIHEFMYPLMQGYDSVVLKVDGEIGGNDQTFNMLTGRDLMKEMVNKEKFVLTTKLLVDNSGVKMGKTMGNMASITDTASDMFGKVMSWTDGMILGGFELCTFVPIEEIEKIKQGMAGGVNPRDVKVRLAKEIVTIYHSKEEADKAEENFVNTFKDGGLPEKIDEVMATNGEALSELSVKAGLVKSKGEFRRLVLENAVSNQETGDKITDPNWKVISTAIFKIGKRRFLKVVVK
jgi:tyrosyl-tRNA synthetase